MKPRLIYFNRPPKHEAWGGGAHFITDLYSYLRDKGYQITFDLRDNPDLVFVFDPRPEAPTFAGIDQIIQYKNSTNCRVLLRINDTDSARPLDLPWRDAAFLKSAAVADHVIFISRWVKDYHEKNGLFAKKFSIIHNGCNEAFFYKKASSSFLSHPVRLVTHHWSTNLMKGFDVYETLAKSLAPSEYSFTFVGRWNEKYSFDNVTVLPPLYGEELGSELRRHDIYVTASKFEACGMHHIEAASCGLPVVYHKNGGGICEIAKHHGEEFESIEECIEAIRKIKANYERYRSLINYETLCSEHCLKQYEKVIMEL